MGVLNSEKSNLSHVHKIAIFRALQLGDLLCSIPAIRALRYAFPNAHIAFIGLASSKDLISRFASYIDEFIVFPGFPGLPEQEFNAENFEVFSAVMLNKNFDLIIQMQGNGSIVNTMLADLGAKRLAGFSIDEKELLNPLMMPYPNQGHEINRHLKLMEHLGIENKGAGLEFPLTVQDENEYNKTFKPYLKTGKYICIHPGSRGAWRQWPIANFASLGNICSAYGFTIVITGTSAEIDIAENLSSLLTHKPFIASGKTNLGTMALLLKNSFALLSNCTGVSHLAAALGTPSLIISMDGEAERWAPLNKQLHQTFDWTKNTTYTTVEKDLIKLLIPSSFQWPHQSSLHLDRESSLDKTDYSQNG